MPLKRKSNKEAGKGSNGRGIGGNLGNVRLKILVLAIWIEAVEYIGEGESEFIVFEIGGNTD